jgi:hypothetical protein
VRSSPRFRSQRGDAGSATRDAARREQRLGSPSHSGSRSGSRPAARAAGASPRADAARAVADDAFDLIVLRPAGIVRVGTGRHILRRDRARRDSLSRGKGTIDGLRGSYEVFVFPPYEYTFKRDLGEF